MKINTYKQKYNISKQQEEKKQRKQRKTNLRWQRTSIPRRPKPPNRLALIEQGDDSAHQNAIFWKDKKCIFRKTLSKQKLIKIYRRAAAEWTETGWREWSLLERGGGRSGSGKQTRTRQRDGDYFCGDAAGGLGTWFMGFISHKTIYGFHLSHNNVIGMIFNCCKSNRSRYYLFCLWS